MQILLKIEVEILFFILHNMHNTIMDNFMVFFTTLGNKGLVYIVISLLLILNRKYRKIGIMVLVALILAAILGEGILKPIFQRPRPFINYPNVNLLIDIPPSYSFPSGHAITSFAVAGILANEFKNIKVIIYGLAILMAFSRLYLFVHYPTDVIVGATLGMMCSMFVIFLFKKCMKLVI
ncbi:MAG: phosphatase PAP2 family protein [Eubacteriaceae bacterium]